MDLGSRTGNYKEQFFWAVTQFSPVDVRRHFGGMYWLHLLARYIPNMSSTLKMEAESYFETSVNFYGLHSTTSQKVSFVMSSNS
jgi:hypothetical protein